MKIDKSRRMQGKTNYRKRLILLKGNVPRLVIRKTNKYVIVQIIESKHAQDKIITGIITKDLIKYGWPESKKGSLKSIAACYLAGFLAGKKSNAEKVILDTGLIPNTKGSRIYAVVKGISDSGVQINCDEKMFPEEIKAEGIDTDKIKEKISGNKNTEVKKINTKKKETKY